MNAGREHSDLRAGERRIVLTAEGETRLHRALASPTRARLLERLRAREESCSVDEIAAGFGLHANTVRAHLQVLEEAGLVVSSPERSAGPGRPRRLFAALSDTQEHESTLLAAMLASALAPLPDRADVAITAGRSWGHVLVERLEPGQRPDEETCVARVSALLRRRGFAPETVARALVLHRCPFRDLAERYPGVVCSLHAGLIDGALDELGAPVELEGIEHGTPVSTACLARLRSRVPATGRSDDGWERRRPPDP